RQAFVVQMVKNKKDLPNAIALNSSVVNLTRLIGPAIAGVMIATIGEGACFLVNGLSYIGVLIALLNIKVDAQAKVHFDQRKIIESLKVGYHATFKNKSIATILFFLSFMSLFGMPYITLFPALAAKVPNGGAHALGWITSSVGVGSLVSALYLVKRQGPPALAKIVGYAAVAFALFLIVLSRLDNIHFILFCVFSTGMSMMLQLSSTNSMVQSIADDDKRGRIMSFFNVALLGALPFGSLLMGFLAEHLGIHNALLINGSICIVGAIVYLKKAPAIDKYILENA
ncbi:MAG: MFS transporter, partial [Bacteriovorax sp.]|nr:MFS transporter [Bacteriovorax sp.]